MKRTFTDAPNAVRCKADIKLRDGSTAQCGRREAWDGLELCWQHQRKLREADDKGFGADGWYSGEHGNRG